MDDVEWMLRNWARQRAGPMAGADAASALLVERALLRMPPAYRAAIEVAYLTLASELEARARRLGRRLGYAVTVEVYETLLDTGRRKLAVALAPGACTPSIGSA